MAGGFSLAVLSLRLVPGVALIIAAVVVFITVVLAVPELAGPLVTPCLSSCRYHLRNCALIGFLLI